MAETVHDVRYYEALSAALLLRVAAACLGAAGRPPRRQERAARPRRRAASPPLPRRHLDAARATAPKDRAAPHRGSADRRRARAGLAARLDGDARSCRSSATTRCAASCARFTRTTPRALLEFGDAVYRGDDSRRTPMRRSRDPGRRAALQEGEIDTTRSRRTGAPEPAPVRGLQPDRPRARRSPIPRSSPSPRGAVAAAGRGATRPSRRSSPSRRRSRSRSRTRRPAERAP